MTFTTSREGSDSAVKAPLTATAMSEPWSISTIAQYFVLPVGLLCSLLLFYAYFYSIHTDLAGILLSSRLAITLGDSFAQYSVYFPPAERAWFSLAVALSGLTGLRLDLSGILMTGLAVLFSTGLAFNIRQRTVGSSPLFFALSAVLLVILPILYKNVFGLREHMVVLGLWPYIVLRISDPDGTKIGRTTRMIVGAWLGATLLLKYVYCLVVLFVELADAAIQKRPRVLFRIENILSGSIVCLYLFVWLVLDPSQREAIRIMASAVDANLTNQATNLENSAVHLALSLVFVLLAVVYKLPARVTLIGLALVTGAIVAAWIQSRWYSHHLFPITLAYIAWLWMIYRYIKLLWVVAIALFFGRTVVGEFLATANYQEAVHELDLAMVDAGLSVAGKRVGILTMHPSPLNQYLASNWAWRWTEGMNIAYVAAELKSFDRPENANVPLPPVKLDDPGMRLLHDEMLDLWEDLPPDVLILDQSTSWPLRNIKVEWTKVFSQNSRFQAILAQYRPVLVHKGERLEFTYYVRLN